MAEETTSARDLAISELDEIESGKVREDDYFIVSHLESDGSSYKSYKQTRKDLLKDEDGKDIFSYDTVFQMSNPVMKPMFMDHDPNSETAYNGKLYWVKAGEKVALTGSSTADYYDSLTRLNSFIASELSDSSPTTIAAASYIKWLAAQNHDDPRYNSGQFWRDTTTLTIAGRRTKSGLFFTDDEQNANVAYNKVGIAWLYVVNNLTTPSWIMFPRTKWNFVGTRGSVGQYVRPGIPDHYHDVRIMKSNCGCAKAEGIRNSHSTYDYFHIGTYDTYDKYGIYGKSTTVQPPATEMDLWFAV